MTVGEHRNKKKTI